MSFDFNLWSKFHNQRLGRRVHIAVSLIDLRDSRVVSAHERQVLAHAVEYIKALELEVAAKSAPVQRHIQD